MLRVRQNVLVQVRSFIFDLSAEKEIKLLFFFSGDLRKHFSKHLNEKPFKCEVCNRGFSRKDNLRTHMKTHRAGVQGVKQSEQPTVVASAIGSNVTTVAVGVE